MKRKGAISLCLCVRVTEELRNVRKEGAVRRAIREICDSLLAAAKQPPYDALGLMILGPAPAPVVKVNDRYRYRVTVIGRNDKVLRGLLAAFMKAFSKRGENRGMQIYTDCNLMD